MSFLQDNTWQVLAAAGFVLISLFWMPNEQNQKQRWFYTICLFEVAFLAWLVGTVHHRADPVSPTSLLVMNMVVPIVVFLLAWRHLSQRPGNKSLRCWVLTSLTVGLGLCLELMLAASIAANQLPDGSETWLYDKLMVASTCMLIGGLVAAAVGSAMKVAQAEQRPVRP